MKIKLAILALFLTSVASAFAQNQNHGPSLRETADWISQTLQIYGGDSDTSDNSVYLEPLQNVQLDDACKFSYDSVRPNMDKKGRQHGSSNIHVDLLLNEITDVNYFMDGNGAVSGITLKAGRLAAVHEDNKPSNQLMINVETRPHGALADGTMPENPQSMVPRLVTAFQHAVSICKAAHPAAPVAQQPF
ncbi:MAG TPA: hypothetical protein VND65_05880 [Candidatus Binatia bacterium]|nr:hypothetical protein [Candidatus Binatia bacterium]